MPSTTTRRRASVAVSIGVTATLATTLTGCGNGATDTSDEYARICRDTTTQQRVEDEKCNESGSGSGYHGHSYMPYFFFLGNNSRTRVPAVGESATGGTSTLPDGKSARSGVSSKGETFARGTARGGFGGSGKGGFGG
ncbi:tRNA-dihydrouridine synthase [Galactobacter valiniphilus]|uniref:tRNA-dihydrouridine synthase n=1 Tax=Galactobacter valiniphilus TaxID=2676122 RepID=UPI003734FC1D